MKIKTRPKPAAVSKFLHVNADGNGVVRLAALGPAGTSSEAVATAVADDFFSPFQVELLLFGEFDELQAALRDGGADYGLVPAAYAGANKFYFDPRLKRVSTFHRPTPSYGLAVRPGLPAAGPTVLATHPAPVPLVEYFAAAVPEFDWANVTVREVSSTSVAARMVSTGEADLAITNAKAAEMYGLTFVADYGTIAMDWILFAPRPAE